MGFCRSGSTAKSNLAQSRKDAEKSIKEKYWLMPWPLFFLRLCGFARNAF